MTQLDDGTEILQLTQEALDLAVTACHFDREENYVGAYDYYDKCILNIDEIIGKIPHTSSQWKKLMELRGQYDDRMDQLKEMEAQRGTLSSFAFGGMGGGSSSNNSNNNNNTNNSTTTNSGGSSRSFMTGRKKKKSTDMEEFQFQEIFIVEDFTYNESPQNLLEIPYWQLRNIARSIEMGAFLTKSLFIPKQIWQQNDVKFSGFNAKSAAFEIIINLITNEIETLYRVHDEDSMGLAEVQFYNMEEELISLRNQLAKSFPYIKEVTLSGGNSGNLEDSSSHITAATNTTASNNSSHGVVTVNPAAAAPAPVGNGGENVNQNPINSEPSYILPPVSSSSSKNKSLTHMVSAFGKSMKKYAEVGLHRLAVALPSRVSADDLTEYKNKILRLSEKSQVFVSWIRFIDGLKAGQLVGDSHLIPSVEDVDERGSFSVQQVTLPPFILEKVQLIGQSLVNITNAIRDIVCEILLRDIEYLLDRFLHHTRKAYTRMHWDQDYSGSSDN